MKRTVCFLFFIPLIMVVQIIQAQVLIVGTYTDAKNSGKGIYLYDFNSKNGALDELNLVEINNPSYQVVSKNEKFVYSVNEEATGKISAFAFNKKKLALIPLNTLDSKGDSPCYLEIDKTGNWLFCSNYSSGDFSVYALQKDGSIGSLSQFIKHTGSGPDTSRQQSPHVHSTTISPDNKYLYVCDLGTDKITAYPFNAISGKLDTSRSFSYDASPGSGPRHMVITGNGKFAYNVDEMSGTVNAFKIVNAHFEKLKTESHLTIQKGAGAGADIHLSPDERFLYVSQRSNSTVEIYSVNKTDGTITYVGVQATLGDFPRNFTIHPSGNYLLAANQKSNTITVFKINKRTGLLTDTGRQINIGTPVSLKWISK